MKELNQLEVVRVLIDDTQEKIKGLREELNGRIERNGEYLFTLYDKYIYQQEILSSLLKIEMDIMNDEKR